MALPTSEIQAIPAFAQIPSVELAAAARISHPRLLSPGEFLWHEGDAALDLGILLSGELAVLHEGVTINQLKRCCIFGETSVFTPNPTRSASLRAESDAVVMLLPVYDLDNLRICAPGFYCSLLELSLQGVVDRMGRLTARLERLSGGFLQLPKPTPRRKRWGHPFRAQDAPPLLLALRWLPGLTQRPKDLLTTMIPAFEAERLEEGQMLFAEGEPAEEAYLLVEGAVRLTRDLPGEGQRVLARMLPCAMFGTCGLFEPFLRTVTACVVEEGWAYSIQREAPREWDDATRATWLECMVHLHGSRLRNADRNLSWFLCADRDEQPLNEQDKEDLLQAAGALLGG